MLAKMINNETKEVIVANSAQREHFETLGFSEMEVEKAYTGNWYLTGYAPQKPYDIQRAEAYPSIPDQLDMIYWDKVNGTNVWQSKIAEIKAQYPKQ